MRLVLDTNVLVSGLLNPYVCAGTDCQLGGGRRVVSYFDACIFSEYRDVLLRPAFGFRIEHVEALLEEIRSGGTSVAARPLSHRLPDQDDEPFLEVAPTAAAEYLVTGNVRHYPARFAGPSAWYRPPSSGSSIVENRRSDWQTE